MSFYGSKVDKSSLIDFLCTTEKVANLKFDEDLQFNPKCNCFSRDEITDKAMDEIAEKCYWIVCDADEIQRLCLELAEKIHMYMKNLPKAEADARVICNKWFLEENALDEQEREAREKAAEEQRKASEAQRKVDEEQRRRRSAIYRCRSKLDNKIYQAKNDIREFHNDCWRKKFRKFIADVLNEDAGITGKKIAENANKTGAFSKYISPYAVYSEWNDVKKDIAAGVFGQNYPDNIVEEDTLEKSLETNHVIKDTDLSNLLKKDLSIVEILHMLDAVDGAGSNTVRVIPDEDLAYEKFIEKDGDEVFAYYDDVEDSFMDALADSDVVDEDSIVIDDFLPDVE